MFWTSLALVALVVLGGFLSYYGDLQGRRWGKKRVSILGLRPKHTAILITSLTGAFIALLSILTVLIVAPTLREVVLRGERAIRENKRLNAILIAERIANQNRLTPLLNELKARESERQQLIEERRLIGARLQTERARLARLREDLQARQREIQEAQQTVRQLAARNVQLLRRQQLLEQDLKRGQRLLASVQRRYRTLARQNQNAEAINRELGQQNLALSRSNLELEQQNHTLEEENVRLSQTNLQLKQEGQELARKNQALEEANRQQLAANRENLKQFAELQAKIRELQAEQDALYSRLVGTRQAFNQSFAAVRQGRLILHAGSELGRRIVPAHQGPIAVRRELERLLDEASALALRLGAVPGENGRAVAIVRKRVVTPAGVQNTSEKDSIDALAENLAGRDVDTVVIAHAINNTVAGEQVLIECTLLPVRPVFRKGQVVAERVIDGRRPSEVVADAIVQFLQRDISLAAKREGIIPQVDPETGTEQVGIITTRDIVSLTDKVRRLRGRVRLEAIARDDLTSADTLRLTFGISRVE